MTKLYSPTPVRSSKRHTGWAVALLALALQGSALAQTTTFSYTGAPATYTVPAGITRIAVSAEGANHGFSGGKGALVTAQLQVTPGEILTVVVGGAGSIGFTGPGAGGYNGGGTGGATSQPGQNNPGEGGSGATDLRRIPGASSASPLGSGTLSSTLSWRLLTAGGAAGGGVNAGAAAPFGPESGGAGTTSGGGAGGIQAGGTYPSATGGTGTLGMGGNGGNDVNGGGGGAGGGGGYYGGGGGAGGGNTSGPLWGPGGGGSSYVEPSALASGYTPAYTLRTSSGGPGSPANAGVLTITPQYTAPTISSFSPTTGPAGTLVTITGNFFTNATSVAFNGVAANGFTVNSATSITATVPGLASTGPITVTTPGGTATSSANFTVVSRPVITSFSPGYVKSGDAITITGLNLQGTTQLTFNGAPQTVFTVNAAGTQITTTVPDRYYTSGSNELPLTSGPIRATTAAGTATSPSRLRIFNVVGYYYQPGGYNTPVPQNTSPGSYFISSGDQIYVKGSGFLGATGGAFNGAFFGCGSVTNLPSSLTVLNDSMAYLVFQPNLAGFRSVSAAAAITTSLGTLSPYGTGGNQFFANLIITNPFASCLSPTSGPASTRVTVSGYNFFTFSGGFPSNTATGLTFNGIPGLNFSANSSGFPQTVSADLPAGLSPGTITVAVVGTGGLSFAGSNVELPFTLTASTPTVTAFSPGSGSVGISLTIDGTNLAGTSLISFGGSSNNTVSSGFTVNAAGTQITGIVVPSGAATGPISVTTPNGTASSSTSFTVLRAGTPTNFSYSGGPQTYTVPAGVTQLQVRATGAGAGFSNKGAQVTALIRVVPGEVLTVVAGNRGSIAHFSTPYLGGPGGYNGGGDGGSANTSGVGSYGGEGGGGASDLRRISGASSSNPFAGGTLQTTLNSRVVTAGGAAVGADAGTSGSMPYDGKNGTTTSGGAGGSGINSPLESGFSGSLGEGGRGGSASYSGGPGGGGGYYGGGGAAAFSGSTYPSAGGGSSYVLPSEVVSGTTPVYALSASAGAAGSLTLTPYFPASTLTAFTPGSGPVGTVVTITGTNFTGSTAVAFNGTAAASFTVNSATQITATVAAGSTSGSISVTTPGGTVTSATSFTVTVTAPAIASFTPGSGPVGTSVSITGSNFTGATAVAFNGTAASSFTVNSATSITATVPAGASSGTISVTTPGGTATSTASFTITVPDLTVSSAQAISGTYNNVTVTGTGIATLGGPLTVNGTLTVQTGGQLLTECQALTGPGSFVLQAGATLGICDAAGIAASGSSGAVRLNGTRSFSDDALYLYNGPAAQATGAGLPALVRELTVSTTGGDLTLSNNLGVRQVLRLTAGMLGEGNLDLGGRTLTLRSGAAGTALLVNHGAGRVLASTGTCRMERYIDPALNAGSGYHHYSSPIPDMTIGQLATTGFTPVLTQAYNTSATPANVTPFPNVFAYDQNRLSTTSNNLDPFSKGWVVPTATTPMVAMQGYTVNIPASALVAFTGTSFNQGQAGRFLSPGRGPQADAGWALVGNPYPSPFDLSVSGGQSRVNLDAANYIYESSSQYGGQYRAYVNGMGGGNPLLAAGQGFFVRMTTVGQNSVIGFANGGRVTSFATQPAFRRGTPDTRALVQLGLRTATAADELYVYAEAGATPGFDAAYDAVKLANPSGLNLTTRTAAGEDLAIQGLPAFTAGTTLPLTVQVPTAGSVSFMATLRNLPTGLTAYLVDAVAGTRQDLRTAPAYTFTAGRAGAITGRFALVFGPANAVLATATADATVLALYPNPAHGSATLSLPAAAQVREVQVFDALGRAVRTVQLPANATTTRLELTGLPAGVYLVRCGAAATKLLVE